MALDSGIRSLVEPYRPSLFVLASQVAAATLNAAAKFIETIPEPVHPFFILYIRMLITGLGCTWYLWHIGSFKSAVFIGESDVRGFILLRAFGGVCGATGFFFSILYLSLSEATALSFLGPLGSLILTRYLSFATVQWTDCIGAVGALIGVVLIAQPEDIFGSKMIEDRDCEAIQGYTKGLAFGVLGFFGGVIALTSIRRVGTRAHPLTSVNMFAWGMVFVSGFGLLFIPGATWPRSPFVWACLIYIGTCGFIMEYFLTIGISNDTSSAATLMIYSQIVWALMVDRVLFQETINIWAILGAVTIISSLCLVTLVGGGNKLSGTAYKILKAGDDECVERLSLEEIHTEGTSH